MPSTINTLDIPATIGRLKASIAERMIGQRDIIEAVLIGLFAGGHVLLEGLPGLGKTLLAKTISELLDLRTARIQCTPDLTPTDIIGTHLMTQDDHGQQVLTFHPGPVFTQILLADEINRALPRAQAALLEAMQERQVTVRGVPQALAKPFILIATQNPIEQEGTHPLPEAQLDRFVLKVDVRAPGYEDLRAILQQTTRETSAPLTPVMSGDAIMTIQTQVRQTVLPGPIEDYIVRLILATHPDDGRAPKKTRESVLHGASPRGAQSVAMASKARAVMQGRDVQFEDVEVVAVMALQHRLILNYAGVSSGTRPSQIIEHILQEVSRYAD